ncbi:MAG: NAD-dependent epimerase/dehydratase family protein [Thermoleophilia bacterium]
MKVLVTGGSGFIGSHVVDILIAHGHEPRIFDIVPSPYAAPDEVETIVGDLLDLESLRGAARGCDVVIHLAAVSDVNEVVRDPSHAELVNARGTEVMLEAALLEKVKRVLYASTVWVYGGAAGEEPLDEDTSLVPPAHFYTATKVAGELFCHSFDELYGLEQTILRFGIPYGPRARASTVVAQFVSRALAGEPLTVTGDGAQTRQFVYVEDLAEGIVAALAPVAGGKTYNLVGSEQVSVRQIAETVQQLVGDVPIVYVDDRPADLRSSAISGERAERELGWRLETPFHQGVRSYVAWVKGIQDTPSDEPASKIAGNASTVLRQEPAEL